MKTIIKLGFVGLFIMVMFIAIGMMGNDPRFSQSQTVLTNAPTVSNQAGDHKPHVFPHGPMQPLPSPHQQGAQVVHSLLGLEVKFQNGNVNYPGPLIVNDVRYQALAPNERLVDSIKFKPLQGPPFLLLVAIGKSPNGSPIIIPGKFEIIGDTGRGGFILRDIHGRTLYYAGYILPTPAWQSLPPGQTLQDQFCKIAVPMQNCPPANQVNVILRKPLDPKKDIPFLTVVG
jgi:hypothetical protein